MSAPELAALTQSLTQAHLQLDRDQVLEAAEALKLAAVQCATAQTRGVVVEAGLLEGLQALQRRCAQAGQAALARLVATGRDAGAIQRAIRAYTDQQQ